MDGTRSGRPPDPITKLEGRPLALRQSGKGALEAEAFKTIVESTPAPQFITDGKLFLYTNPAFEALTGYTERELRSMAPGEIFPEMSQKLTAGMLPKNGERQPLSYESKSMGKDGARRWLLVTATSVDHMGRPVLLGAVADVSRYRQREEVLARSEAKYRTVFEFGPDAIVIYGVDGEVLDSNPALEEVTGWSREEIARLGIMGTWVEEDKARFEEIRQQTLRDGTWFGEVKAQREGRHFITMETRVKVADTGGEKVVICMSRDITERKRMEEQIRTSLREKEMLLREIHHRVKNNMQIISTLLKLQLRNSEDERTRALFRESQNRILSMAMIHEKLYQSQGLHRIDLGDYIGDLAREAYASFGEEPERVGLKLDVGDISFGMDTAIPCGLIVIELLSNSLKYAFPEGRKGEIFIGLCPEDDAGFELIISDNGVGLPKDIELARLKSLGLRLVADLAQYQLNGKMDLASSEQGTRVRVRFKEREESGGGNA